MNILTKSEPLCITLQSTVLIIRFLIMRFFILCLFLISGVSQSKENPLGLSIQQGYFSKSCLQSIEICFDSNFYSEDDDNIIKAIFLYLDNYDQMKEHYEYRLLLESLSKISKAGDNNLFLLEANIYFQGFHFPQSGSKAVTILESNDLLNYEDPLHLVVLGKAYYIRYIENKREIEEELVKARNYLLKAYKMGRNNSTRALALILANSSNIKDVIMAGELLRYFSESDTGTKSDRDNYKKYLDFMEEKVLGHQPK